jgi:integrase
MALRLVRTKPAHRVAWEDALELFLGSVTDSPQTRESYRSRLVRELRDWGGQWMDELTPADLSRLRAQVMARPLGGGTHRGIVSILRSFLRWTHRAGMHGVGHDEMETWLPIPRRHVSAGRRSLSEAEALQLIRRAGPHRALIATLMGAGLRAGEVCKLDVEDLRLTSTPPTLLVRGKGQRDRSVPIHGDLVSILARHVQGRKGGPVFMLRDGQRMTENALWRTVQRVSAVSGVDVHPHMLRHTYAMRTLRATGDVWAVKQLLGHASVQTTEAYLETLALDDLARKVQGLPTSAAHG